MNIETVSIPVAGLRLAADLYRPVRPGPLPVVIMAHGFGATRDAGLPRFARRFQEAGFLVLVFDYRHFGGSDGEPRQLLSVRRQVEDWHAALHFARELEGGDPRRIGLWGTSYAGGHVIRVAAEDAENAGAGEAGRTGVAAVVAQVPFASGLRTAMELPIRSAIKMTLAAVLDLIRGGVLGGPPLYVPIVGPPGSRSAMALNEAVEGVERLYEGRTRDDRVPARVALDTLLYRPLRHASRVSCPLLVQVAEEDRLTPPGPAVAIARRAPRSTLRSYPTGHFDVYFGRWFEAFSDDQVRFFQQYLGRQVPDSASPAGS